jgi:2-methylcitrate dehydratase PrpD
MAEAPLGLAYAERLLGVAYDDLPETTVTAAKRLLLDSVATAMAGSAAPAVDEAAALVREWYPTGRSGVWGRAFRLPAPWAAFVNAAMLHARDFDDTYDPVPIHPSAPILPAVIAASEEATRAVSGAELLTAYVVGVEAAVRIAESGGTAATARGWHLTSVVGGFGAAMAVAHLWGLSPKTALDTLGLQLCQTSGTLQAVLDKSWAKRFQPAHMSANAVISASMAKAGIDGPQEVFEGRGGLFSLYHHAPFDADVLIQPIDHYAIEDVGPKPYPCCRRTHAAIDAAFEIRKLLADKGVDIADVAKVKVYVSSGSKQLVGSPLAEDFGDVDTQFSIPYTFALALWRGAVGLSDFEGVREHADPRVVSTARAVEVVTEPTFPARDMAEVVAVVETTAGDRVEYRITGTSSGLEELALHQKVADCFQVAKTRMDPQTVTGLCARFDELDDVRELTRLLVATDH